MSDDAPPVDARQRELLERWQSNADHDALDELLRSEVDAIARRLRARARGMLRPSQSASDLAQEAVVRMLGLEDAPVFDDPRALRAYLWTAAWRLLVNRARRPGRNVVELDTRASVALSGAFARTGGFGSYEQSDQRAALVVAINLLKDDEREILTRVYLDGLAIETVAAELGITRSNADMRLTRARRRLAERLVGWAEVVG